MGTQNNFIKIAVIRSLALLVCIAPPLIATVSYFPIWMIRGDAYVLSGFALCLAMLSLIPFYKHLSKILRSPSAYTVWLILFIVFFLLSRIADEMTVISFIGFICNLLGALLFRLARRLEGKEREND
jgi:hypothetical protein